MMSSIQFIVVVEGQTWRIGMCDWCYLFINEHIAYHLFITSTRSNININDVLGNFSLTMVDALDGHYVMGNFTEFKRTVQLVITQVRFDSDSIIQVFEVCLDCLCTYKHLNMFF